MLTPCRLACLGLTSLLHWRSTGDVNRCRGLVFGRKAAERGQTGWMGVHCAVHLVAVESYNDGRLGGGCGQCIAINFKVAFVDGLAQAECL